MTNHERTCVAIAHAFCILLCVCVAIVLFTERPARIKLAACHGIVSGIPGYATVVSPHMPILQNCHQKTKRPLFQDYVPIGADVPKFRADIMKV